ncbi:coiled-coil domain-containing protein [Algibacter lectus]|uniref:MukB N-terminal domain-containing protein n=1 Tax=Algibacter lectus TaxID=221126 RepID=A0A4R8M605_9FLAO|nr:hypothetical protein [Algibacter lectus]MWW26032.1 hypothetical protein [Algibacter lectus]TDY60760.1 hypothetical protein DFQ06_3344 [Algibacter lectus]
MIKYPRIYSFSTVGIIMHFNQDYLLHPIRTDFTGKNGIGKSLIADLFQILFISDKKKIAFGTESFKNNTRLLHTLPYKTSDAYIFINIEIEKDSFITLGVNIPNKKSRPLKSFWILNKAHGINDNNELSDLSIAKNNIPFFKDFIHDNSIPPIETLAIKLRDEKQIYLRSFSDKNQKNELYTFLFENRVLPIDLSIESNLDAFAKVIQSFSKAKTLDTDSDDSLKSFLFEDKTDNLKSEYEKHKADLEKLINDYKDLEELIADIENKQERLTNLSSLNSLYLNSFKEHLLVEFTHTENEILKKNQSLKDINTQLLEENKLIKSLQTDNPKVKKAALKAKKEHDNLDKTIKHLKEYSDIFAKIEALKSKVNELECIKLPAIENEAKISIENIETYEISEIKRRISHFTTVFEDYGSLESIEYTIESQKEILDNRKSSLKSNKADIRELLNLLSKNKKNSLFAELLSQQKTLTESQEAILLAILKGVHWKKPKEIIAGIKYVESLAFMDEKFIENDSENDGYWFSMGGIKEFVSSTKDKQLFKDKDKLGKALSNKTTKLNNQVSAIDKELSHIEAYNRGQKFEPKSIQIELKLDQRLNDFSKLADLKLSLGLIQNLEVKKQSLNTQISNENKLLKKIELKINIPIEKKNLANQLEKLKEELKSIDTKERNLSSQYSSDKSKLEEKLRFLPSLKNQPLDLEKSLTDLENQRKKIETDFSTYFPDLDIKNMDKVEYIGIERNPLYTEFQSNKTNYIGDYKAIISSFEQIKNDPEINEQITQVTYNFEILERVLLGPKIKHSTNISEELKQLNSSRFRMFGAIHETMLNIFKQTKGKFDAYHETIKALNKFFKGKKISGKYYFQLEFNKPSDFDINWINDLQATSQQVHSAGELPFGESVESFVENFFMKTTSFNQKIKFSNLLDPKTYFELRTKFTDEFDNEKSGGSTGESYAAIVLLGIGRLSVVLNADLQGLRFLILEEVSNLDNLNFSTFPNIAEEFGYQILTMTPRPFGSDTEQGWYLHHLIEGAGDKNINYPIPNSYFKTNEGREDLETYLKAQSN